jgi:hypothetical protein
MIYIQAGSFFPISFPRRQAYLSWFLHVQGDISYLQNCQQKKVLIDMVPEKKYQEKLFTMSAEIWKSDS